MADIEKGLPVRTEDDANQYVRTKLYDSTGVNPQEVDADNNAHVECKGDNPAGGEETLRLSELGAVIPDGAYDGTNNTDPGNIGLVGMVRNASPADSQQTDRLTSKASAAGDVRALDVNVRLEGEEITPSNPLPVTVLDDSQGDEVHDYDEAVDIAADGTANHDYSVADSDVFLVEQILCDASGRYKLELQIGDGAVSEAFTTKAVWFGKEDSSQVDVTLRRPIAVTGTVNTTTVRLVKTNRDDDDAQSVYSTIIGTTL